MGTKSTLASTLVAMNHSAAGFKNGRNVSALIVEAQEATGELIQLLKECQRDMVVGDANIALFSALITNLS
jgi:hypothetical protein